jgi:hypothetical protein
VVDGTIVVGGVGGGFKGWIHGGWGLHGSVEQFLNSVQEKSVQKDTETIMVTGVTQIVVEGFFPS